MDGRAAEAARTSRCSHEMAYALIQQLRQDVIKWSDMRELADVSYAMHTVAKFAEDLAKEARILKATADRLAVAWWLKAGEKAPHTIRTEHTSASPKLRTSVKLPDRRKEPEKYEKMMTGLGVPRNLWDVQNDQSAIIQPHWPGMTDLVTERLEQGLPLPPGLEDASTFQEFKLQHYPRKEVGVCGREPGSDNPF